MLVPPLSDHGNPILVFNADALHQLRKAPRAVVNSAGTATSRNLTAFLTWLAVCSAGSAGEKATVEAAADPLSAVERKIGKQPAYATRPRYVLLALGAKADFLVWMVEDGMSIYLDRNANRPNRRRTIMNQTNGPPGANDMKTIRANRRLRRGTLVVSPLDALVLYYGRSAKPEKIAGPLH